jgi:hypothetical protein
MNATTKTVEQKDDSVILIVSALIVALITLFITSGIQHFDWIVYILYAVFIFMGEFLVSSFIFRKSHSFIYTILSIASGSVFGIVFVLKALLPFW